MRRFASTWRIGDQQTLCFPASNRQWGKWSPSNPTSAHWYDASRLSRLIAAEIAHAEDRGAASPTVREFIADFRGLTSSAKGKVICEQLGAARMLLAEYFAAGSDGIERLLTLMKSHSRVVKPSELGMVGRDHIKASVENLGGRGDTLEYRHHAVMVDGVPYAIEVAFAYAPKADCRTLITGLNFSATIGANPFRAHGQFVGLDAILGQQRATHGEPVTVFAHVASPRLAFHDRGKTQIALPTSVSGALETQVLRVTAPWAKQRKAEERRSNTRSRRDDAIARRDKPFSLKEAAAAILPQAFLVASASGTLPANPRQVFYPARGPILELTGKDTLDSNYFCQTLLVDYIEDSNLKWDIAWDDRGHLIEPHTGVDLGLGTLAVRQYLENCRDLILKRPALLNARVATHGSRGRYGAILFIEKEGFTPLLRASCIAERFDLALMSSKGMSTTAARLLIDQVAGRQGLPVLVLHDFDISGFGILKTLGSDGRRYVFEHPVQIIDLGLRLSDVERLNLQPERVTIGRHRSAVRNRLKINGATPDEIEYLLAGQRVELNAMTSDVFVRFVEEKLVAAGVRKVIPPLDKLTDAFALFRRGAKAERLITELLGRVAGEPVEAPPDDLEVRVRQALEDSPTTTWDEAVRKIAETT